MNRKPASVDKKIKTCAEEFRSSFTYCLPTSSMGLQAFQHSYFHNLVKCFIKFIQFIYLSFNLLHSYQYVNATSVPNHLKCHYEQPSKKSHYSHQLPMSAVEEITANV